MKPLYLTETDILLCIIVTSGILAGLLAHLMIPSFKKELQSAIKSGLFGIVFALMSSVAVHFIFPRLAQGVPAELNFLFLWTASFVPALILALAYAAVSRRYTDLEF